MLVRQLATETPGARVKLLVGASCANTPRACRSARRGGGGGGGGGGVIVAPRVSQGGRRYER